MRKIVLTAVVSLSLLLGFLPVMHIHAVAAATAYDWLQFNGDPQHDGNNTAETAISTSTASTLQKRYTATLPDVADGAPAYLSSVTTANGTQDLVFVTTKHGSIVSLDAHTGVSVWSHQYGPNGCVINNGTSQCYTTSSPAIDPNRQYVYSYELDGYVHKYAVGTGVETTSGGWPELTTSKGFDEKESPALSIATVSGTSYLYAPNGGYPGDNGDYQGHLTTINLSTGAQHVFNTLCSNQTDVHFVEAPGSPDCAQRQSAVWARPGAVFDPATNRIYIVTGNAQYSAANFDWGDTVLALNPDGTGARNSSNVLTGNPLDSFTPSNYATLNSTDQDLGSTAPAILPAPAGSAVQHPAVQGGKDAMLRLLNLDNLSGQGAPGHTGGEISCSLIPVPQGGQVLSQPAVWVNPADNSTWVFVGNNNGISGLKLALSGTTPVLQTQWKRTNGGSSPLVANGVLFFAGNNSIQALNPTTGAQLWQDATIGGIHWESPVVANGMLYITDESGKLNAYSLPASASTTKIFTAVSTQQYTMSGNTGSWVAMDPTNLAITLSPSTTSSVLLSANADLWTSTPSDNQDMAIWISGGSYGSGQIIGWKESGGVNGYAPNAAYLQTVVNVSAGTTYQVQLMWRSGGSGKTIWAGAGPLNSSFSPTRLTAELSPASNISSAVSTQQYTMSGNTGSWVAMDPTNLALTLSPTTNSTVLLSANADLWTSTPSDNQDMAIWISGGSYGAGQVLGWKESGGVNGYAPNAAYLQTVVNLSGGTTYQVQLMWRSGNSGKTIWAGAGPLNGTFSPTRLTAEVAPSAGTVSSAVSTQQYSMTGNMGSWVAMDPTNLALTLSPSATSTTILSANADLWTSTPSDNQDMAIWISGGSYGSGQVIGWKESGGVNGYAPNAAYLQTVVTLNAGTTYHIQLMWRSGASGTTIWAGAGPLNSSFSPTRLTAVAPG
jgi:PQQ-like domain